MGSMIKVFAVHSASDAATNITFVTYLSTSHMTARKAGCHTIVQRYYDWYDFDEAIQNKGREKPIQVEHMN